MSTSLQLATVALLLAQTSGDRQPAPGVLRLPRSMVSLILKNELPARVPGVVEALVLEDGTEVREGMSVRKGQVLGTLDGADARARFRVADTEHKVSFAEHAKSQAGLRAADATIDVARAEVEESKDINKRAAGSVPHTQVRRQELTVERAASEAEVARRELETAGLTIEAKEAQRDLAGITLHHHQIVSAMDGMIVQLYRKPGDWVSPGDPILRIVYMDKVRIEGFVDADLYTPDQIDGREVEVTVQLPQGRVERFSSVISYASPLIEASGDYRVWCDVANRQHNGHWVLRPGMYADLEIKLNSRPAALAARP